ncbi:putative oxidoreductase EphD [Fusarium oxysporum f. sp. albedinis]|nr:putative oxidoreductase EphD [Fusarium oxysporum f. sp. albedinis]
MCFLAEKEIPASLLPPADDEMERDEAIGILKAYAFVSERSESNLFDMHQLVRLAMRNWLENEKKLEGCITAVVQRLAFMFPSPTHENRDMWLKYLPHGRMALDLSEVVDDNEAKSGLLFNIGVCLDLLGKYQQAEETHRAGLELRQKAMGTEYPDTLVSMNNLANVLQRQGRYWEAEQMHQQTLKLRQKVLGNEHPDTLASMKNLCCALQHPLRPSSPTPEHFRTRVPCSYTYPPPQYTISGSGYPGYNSGRYGPPQPQYHPQPQCNYYPYDSPKTTSKHHLIHVPRISHAHGDHSCRYPTNHSHQPAYGGGYPQGQPSLQPPFGYQQHPPQQQYYSGPPPQQQQYGGHYQQGPPQPDYGSRPGGAPAPPPTAPQQFGHGAPNSYNFRYSNCTGRRKALLIGINYFNQRGQLRGCINDVRNMTAYLSEQVGYKREDMVILTDDQQNPMSQPTKQTILRAMHWLVEDAQPNDSLFFHYSDMEPWCKVICSVDFRQTGPITENEMHRIMVHPLQAGVRLTAIFDSCHSGTALGLPYIYSTQGILKAPNLAKEEGQGLLGVISSYSQGDLGGVASNHFGFIKKAATGDEVHERNLRTKTSPADVIMWTGSRDDQTSWVSLFPQ